VYAEEITVGLSNTRINVLDVANPAGTGDSTGMAFNAFLNTLYDEDQSNAGVYLPSLATSYETTDSQHVTFHLREDVYFHNGAKFTADDVAFTIDRAKENPGTNANDRYGKIESYDIVNDYTITFHYAKVNPEFLSEMSWCPCGILSRKAFDDDPDEGYLIGTGPWVVQEFSSGDFVRFTRNDNYWGELPKTKVLTFKYIAEEASRLTMLENGETQVTIGLNPNDYPYVESNTNKFDTYTFTVHGSSYIGFNMTDPLMSDHNFRMAVASAIIREDMILAGRNGYAQQPSSGAFWGWGTAFKNNDIPFVPYDLDAARDYLSKTSYNGETIMLMGAIPDHIKMCEVIQQQLQMIGLNVEIDQTDTVGLAAAVKWGSNTTQMICHTGNWLPEASVVRTYYTPGAQYNRVSYTNEEILELISQADVTADPKEREALYRKIQEVAAEDMPFIGLCHLSFVVATLKGVGGLFLSESSMHDMSYVYQVIG